MEISRHEVNLFFLSLSPLKTKGQKVVGKVNQGKRKISSLVDSVNSKVVKTLNVPIESFGDTNIQYVQPYKQINNS